MSATCQIRDRPPEPRIASAARATLSRGFSPTSDGNLVLEDRLAGSISWSDPTRHLPSLMVSPFVAHTRTWTRDAVASRSIGTGASLPSHALDEVFLLRRDRRSQRD